MRDEYVFDRYVRMNDASLCAFRAHYEKPTLIQQLTYACWAILKLSSTRQMSGSSRSIGLQVVKT
jgi:hypothetical protein